MANLGMDVCFVLATGLAVYLADRYDASGTIERHRNRHDWQSNTSQRQPDPHNTTPASSQHGTDTRRLFRV